MEEPSRRRIGPFEAQGYRFVIEVEGETPFDVEAVLADLRVEASNAPAETCRLTFSDAGQHLALVRGGLTMTGPTLSVFQEVFTGVGQAICKEPPGIAVHGTTVSLDGRGVLLLGPDMSGKSTLAGRLLLDGAALVAEDVSIVSHGSARVRAFHRPIALSEESVELLGLPAASADLPAGYERDKLYFSSAQAGYATASDLRPVVVALVDHHQTDTYGVPPAELMCRILELGLAPIVNPRADLETLAGLLASGDCASCGSRDLRRTATAIEARARSHAGALAPVLVEEPWDGAYAVSCGAELVLVEPGRTRRMNALVSSVWLLRREGLTDAEVAEHLAAPGPVIDDAVRSLGEVGLA